MRGGSDREPRPGLFRFSAKLPSVTRLGGGESEGGLPKDSVSPRAIYRRRTITDPPATGSEGSAHQTGPSSGYERDSTADPTLDEDPKCRSVTAIALLVLTGRLQPGAIQRGSCRATHSNIGQIMGGRGTPRPTTLASIRFASATLLAS